MNWRVWAGSVFAHGAFLVLVFLVIPTSRPEALPTTIPVNLVSIPRGKPSVAPPRPVVQKESRPKMEAQRTPNRPREKVVKLPQGKAEEPTPPKTEEPVVETADTEPVGTTGLAAGVAVDAVDFEFTYYLIALRNRIGRNWSAPAGIARRPEPVRVVVFFRIDRNGGILDTEVEESSGIPFFDQSAVRAVRIANPVPPLPMGFEGNDLGVHFAFEFTGY